MFVPILKFRKAETSALKKVSNRICDEIVPLFEIFKDSYKTTYEIDKVSGKYITRLSATGRKIKIKSNPTVDDINTLDVICDCINGKKAFIDFLRVNEKKYTNFDVKEVLTGIELRDFDYYKKRVLEIANYENLIPIISIQDAFNNNVVDMRALYEELKTKAGSIAIRVTVDCYNKYITLLKSLRKSDYILFDIGETNYKGIKNEIEDFINNSFYAKQLILNSSRPREFFNKDFEEDGKTNLIGTDIIGAFKNLGFTGFGDYCGCKDVLPYPGIAIKGSALSLLYNYNDNAFWVNTNKNTSLGVIGYRDVKKKVMAQKPYLDPDDSCLAYKQLARIDAGNYSTWIEICIIRYIDQLYKNMDTWN